MKPYPEATCDPGEMTLNKELSSARVAIECAFGHLKSRWRILQKRLDSRITFSVKNSIACAVLHNFCIKVGEEWEDDFYDDDDDRGNEQNNDFMQDGEDIRELLKHSLNFFFELITGLPSYKFGFRSSVQKNGPPREGRHEGLVPRNDVLTNGFI